MTKITIDDGTSTITYDSKQPQKDTDSSGYHAGLYCLKEMGLLRDDLLKSKKLLNSFENTILHFNFILK